MTITCPRCKHDQDSVPSFCQSCGKVLNRKTLRSVRPMGFVGVQHSLSPKIDEWWNTGDPEVFDRP